MIRLAHYLDSEKKSTFDMLCSSITHQCSLSQLGTRVKMVNTTKIGCEKFICCLYTKDTKLSLIDEARYRIFCQKGQKNEILPPTSDSLALDMQCANYQAYLWRRALVPYQRLPSPDGHGWTIILHPVLMVKESAPRGLVELTVCGCVKSMCQNKHCSCAVNELPCTEACKCMGSDLCRNPKSRVHADASDSESGTGLDSD